MTYNGRKQQHVDASSHDWKDARESSSLCRLYWACCNRWPIYCIKRSSAGSGFSSVCSCCRASQYVLSLSHTDLRPPSSRAHHKSTSFSNCQTDVSTPSQLRSFGPPGSWAVITGASDGIGAEFASQLGAAGFNLVLASRTASKLTSAGVSSRNRPLNQDEDSRH